MKAIGRNILIQPEKQGTEKTKGGLLLAEQQRVDIRYQKGLVVSVGDVEFLVGSGEGESVVIGSSVFSSIIIAVESEILLNGKYILRIDVYTSGFSWIHVFKAES